MKTAALFNAISVFIFAFDARAEDFAYTTNNNAVTIAKYIGTNGVVVVPGFIDGMSVVRIGSEAFVNCLVSDVTIPAGVTSIADNAFSSCASLSTIIIPDTITNIERMAFSHCSGLRSVKIPAVKIGEDAFNSCTSLSSVTLMDSVKSIGSMAFQSCTALATITLPRSITNLGYSVFWGCGSLREIVVDPLNLNFSSFEGVVFDKGKTTLLAFPAGRGGSYRVPDSATSIGRATFSGNMNRLSSVIIPNTVTNIGDEAFTFCPDLETITIGERVIRIGNSAFAGCHRLVNLKIPNSVITLSANAFSSCSGLTTVTVGWQIRSLGDWCFNMCTNLTEIYFLGDRPSAGSRIFDWDLDLTVYYLPGTKNWGNTYGGRPTAPWALPTAWIIPGSAGLIADAFGFRISWAMNTPVVVEAAETLTTSGWSPISTNALTDGWCDFRDPEWTKCPGRFYRVRQQ